MAPKRGEQQRDQLKPYRIDRGLEVPLRPRAHSCADAADLHGAGFAGGHGERCVQPRVRRSADEAPDPGVRERAEDEAVPRGG
eukprot:7386284-Prymnesium_polylepis.1